ncbi:MAG: hypothetical protein M1820_010677 [Bogoriella megaspora]|nr:MAG: hypothetical protein M1820_010677 [Bogoriella megaspora]
MAPVLSIVNADRPLPDARGWQAMLSTSIVSTVFEFGINTNVRVWSLVEAGVAVVAACLPTLGPFITEKGSSSVVDSVRSVLRLGSNSRARATRNETDRERLTFIPSSTSANLHNMLSFQNVVTSISQEDELPNVPESQIMMHCMITQDVEQAV